MTTNNGSWGVKLTVVNGLGRKSGTFWPELVVTAWQYSSSGTLIQTINVPFEIHGNWSVDLTPDSAGSRWLIRENDAYGDNWFLVSVPASGGPYNLRSLMIADSQVAQTTIRVGSGSLPLLAVGNTTVNITWQQGGVNSQMPSTSYQVYPSLEGGISVLGSLKVAVVSGSKTTTGCQLLVTNSGLVSIALGSGTVSAIALA